MKYEARQHYRDPSVASRYDQQFRRVRSLSDLRAQVLGFFETKAFLHLLGQQPGHGTVLDVACGTGRYLTQLDQAGYEPTGADVSPDMLQVARRFAPKADRRNYVCADAAQLPFADRRFDGVTCMRLYHRIPGEIRIEMLREVKRVGRGWAILFFGITSPWLKVRRGIRAAGGGRPTNPYPMTVTDLRNELHSVGLEICEIRPILPVFASGVLVRVKWTAEPSR